MKPIKKLCKNGHLRSKTNVTKARSCKLCGLEAQKIKRQANTALFMWRAAKDRASKSNIDFLIDPSDIVIPQYCPVLGIELRTSDHKRSYHSPSLDRKDNTLGYVRANIYVISWRANRLKSDGTKEEHEAIVKWLSKQG